MAKKHELWQMQVFRLALLLLLACVTLTTGARNTVQVHIPEEVPHAKIAEQVPGQGRGDESRTVPTITCRDEEGRSLSWFIAYKVAKIENSVDDYVQKGLGYAFLKPGSTTWQQSSKNINTTDSIVGKTLDVDSLEPVVHLAYNDQPPGGATKAGGGHQKGVIIANENGGIFLQHSVPHFPSIVGYEYPHSGTVNGQVLFCMTLTVEQIDGTVASILRITRPNLFKFQFPLKFENLYPNLKLLAHKQPDWPKINDVFKLNVGELKIMAMAKSPAIPTEIYSEWIAPSLQTNLDVQTWLNGPQPMPSNCTSKKYNVLNVLVKNVDGNVFTTHVDHSKWAVTSVGGSRPVLGWVCVSDLNRMEHQRRRGGAAYCFQNPSVTSAFQTAITGLEPCPSKT